MQLFVKDLTVIDFSYLDAKRGIVGESWIVDVTLTGKLNDENMVLDFGIVKKQIKAIIDDAVDHKLLLPMQDNKLTLVESNFHQQHWLLDYASERGHYYLQSPHCAFALIDTAKIDIAAVEAFLIATIMPQLPKNVVNLQLELRPEQIAGDYYHYSHGLRMHAGNCQRIAHGHRSQIEIYQAGNRCQELERYWCDRWQDIYIASEADQITRNHAQLSDQALNENHHQYFAYQAPQGRFDIAVPDSVLELVDCDSTVELLADFIRRKLVEITANKNIKVVAYEGVGKGAIAGD